ncbi:hypothetical protein [Deinococcus maricopensis]|uniref:Dolichyl-phosphate-mannose-protein mannosyltransferase family protein 3 n=1 Tax=Deinococcus maricopensis (strain DSM 21211 / LMG 22137 / NRRL B-23946 / LB-34) TaxID=709986 RepID=E8UBN3_DEIML|nr:hypothetical protein [Deinococcus maricopensis]ADV68472.1 dolichyl-phosphate-mannose-protein mannosyltransferase family protein 3 [Deinococcus maricopensis DSM 21211]
MAWTGRLWLVGAAGLSLPLLGSAVAGFVQRTPWLMEFALGVALLALGLTLSRAPRAVAWRYGLLVVSLGAGLEGALLRQGWAPLPLLVGALAAASMWVPPRTRAA